MNKSIDAIDIAKFFASVLIFAMHCGVLYDYNTISSIPELLARWGVPFFFICSAYFLFRKGQDGKIEKRTINLYIKRISSLYAVWLVYNIPNVVYMRLYSKDLSALSTWLFFFKNSILSSTFTGSWYLASSVFSAWFVYTLSKKLQTKSIMGITFIPYLLCVLTSAYKGLLPADIAKILDFFCFPLNIFNGCFYFALGKYICENQQTILKKCNTRCALICSIAFYLLFILELFITKRLNICSGTDLAFSTVLLAASIFLFCLQIDIKIKNGLLLRKLSTIIYCSQGNVLLVNNVLKNTLKLSSIDAFLISSFVIAAICAVTLLIQKNKNWKWSRYLT